MQTSQKLQVLEEIETQNRLIIQKGLLDSLPSYLNVYGRALKANYGDFEKKLATSYTNWEALSEKPTYRRKLTQAYARWYEYLGNTSAAYQQSLQALAWAKKESPPSDKVFADLYLNLGGFAIQNMDLPAAKQHLAQVLSLNLADSDPENIYFANSYLGNMAYFNSNLDSAAFYYQKSLDAIDQLEPNPRNQYYRKSILTNNLAGVLMAQSDFELAEQTMNQTIAFQEKYMATDLDPVDYRKILQSYFRSLDNLAGLYKQLGAYSRARQLLEFSFQRKAEEFGDQDLETAKSRILLGQVYFDMQDTELARKYILQGLRRMQELEEESSYWQGDAIYTLARMEDYLQNETTADSLYRQAKIRFEAELEGDFDVIYLGFLQNFSKFLAENQQISEAVHLSNQARDYLADIGSDNLFLDFNQTLNLASIYELGKDYQSALEASKEAFRQLELLIKQSKGPRDSLQATFLKPQAILIRNRSRFKLTNSDEKLLLSIEQELREGLQIIDSQSDFLFEPSDINIQLELNREYFEFLEQIELELFRLSKNEVFLDRLLAYHEHARYRQIRSRLQRIQGVNFGGVPVDMLNREKLLKENLQQSLQGDDADFQAYTLANKQWNDFLDSLKLFYPKYYQLHFETSESVLNRVYSMLNPEITYLRYLQVNGEWMLLAICGDEKQLIRLASGDLTVALEQLAEQSSQRSFQPELFNTLYNLVWQPAEPLIRTQRVAVIPEGLLFNLSFEVLSRQPIQKWSELTTHALLLDHSFSYQYGLLFLDQQGKSNYGKELVAFAPGFFDGMKKTYSAAFLDRQFLDQSYLQLIPQPFTRKLVEEISTRFDSKVFLEDRSTVANFKSQAGQSRVIHIGTHAVSSNVNPGDSRLVFAKSSENPLLSHELFASEIYELDLQAELGVLLACESGKPSFSPGEGMISLAHAFNYSGTKSLLMGLWKIDEKASVSIAEDFYGFLEDGLSKDEALRKAKLAYLAKAKGRELDPAFWAGLILLGDPAPVDLKKNQPVWPILTGFLLLASGVWFFMRKKKQVI
ncbi:CHAT domain-containing protein [Algoriphagus namhaensis]